MLFLSVEHIMRDVNYGWFLRYLHANCASFFFIVVYSHIFRNLYYGSYTGSTSSTWLFGCLIYVAMMATAFLGYVLPWGQMSLWGATVITNFFSIFKFIGLDLVTWLWGGFSVNSATLTRFFSLHFFIPFLLLVLVFMHLLALHNTTHNNPLGIRFSAKFVDNIIHLPFYPYFIVKDLVGFLLLSLSLSFFIFFLPNFFGHTDNFIPANFLSTPQHIVPEWYFLPFYAILRSIPNKAFGVILMFASLLSLFFLPFITKATIINASFRPVYRIAFWFFLSDCFLLGWVGGNPVEFPFYQIGQSATFFYFFYLLFFIPIASFSETFFYMEENLSSEPITGEFFDTEKKTYANLFYYLLVIAVVVLTLTLKHFSISSQIAFTKSFLVSSLFFHLFYSLLSFSKDYIKSDTFIFLFALFGSGLISLIFWFCL